MRTNRFFGVICHLTLSHLQWKVVTRLLFVFSLHMFSTSAFQIEPLQSEGVCQDHITHFMTTFALAGEPVVLKCPTVRYLLINNHPLDLNLTWQKNGSAIMPAGHEETTRVFSEGDSVWFLPASLRDSGDYTCIRSNSTYCVELSIELAVLESAVEDIFYPQMVFTLKSDKVVCPALEDFTQNNEDYELKWYKDGARLDIDSKKFKVLRGTNYLIINNVSTEDSGYYTCQMTFEHEAEQYNVTRIIELETIARKEKSNPVIVSPYQKITLAALGSQLTIPCKVFVGTSSSSHTDVWWEANRNYIGAIYPNGRVREGQRQEFVENNENYIEVPLIFDPVSEEDFSTDFRCAVHNGAAFQMRPTQVRQEEIGLPLYLAVIPVAIAAVIVGGICIHKYTKQRSARGYNAAKSKEQNPLFL